jgi:response regulator RpfG family c-di-GMP phosphodiesterase
MLTREIEPENPGGHIVNRLLIVDENDTFRRDARAHLQGSYEIMDTGNPEHALEMALTRNPDIIMLNLQLPEFRGVELCQTLHSLATTHRIPILMLSSDSVTTFGTLSRNLGARDYLAKPVDLNHLSARVAALLHAGPTDSRLEHRVRLRAALSLRGIDKKGNRFESNTTTDNVSANGFICCCGNDLRKDSIVEVYFVTNDQGSLGRARAVRAEWRDAQSPRYGFRFVTKPRQWFVL